MSQIKTIGIIGAGKLGIVLSQLALKAGYKVCIAGSGDPKKIALSVEVLAPGAVTATTEAVAEVTDVVILALPLSKFRQIPASALAHKLVIDATNHWWEIDGPRDDFLKPDKSSSEAVQEYLSDSRVVKAFNHMGYHDLHDETRPAGVLGRKAIAIAGDKLGDIKTVSRIIDEFGFDSVYIGKLAEGRNLEPGGSVFGASVDAKTLKKLLIKPKVLQEL
jgi:predicted dinucleotide-binding enzyme